MKRRPLHLGFLAFIMTVLLAVSAVAGAANHAVAASGEVVTLPPDDGELAKKLAKVESLMRVEDPIQNERLRVAL